MKTIATALTAGAIALASTLSAQADRHGSSAPITLDPTYIQECGACHTAYIPGLLPQRSWKKIMGDLDGGAD